MTPRATALRRGERLLRFDGVERAVHWTTAILMLELLTTGAILYVPALAVRVGHRSILENIHVYSGLALLVPLLVGVAGPWRKRLLEDLRRFDRWTAADWAWFRPSSRRAAAADSGKFNGGQKAEAALLGGGMVVMLATGTIMRFAPPSWITFQRGATLVHDVGFILIALAVLGHLYYAFTRPEQLKSMLTGRISKEWGKRHAPAWLDGSDLTPRRARTRPEPSAPRGVEEAVGTRRASG